jgi:hypothetical protein
MKKIKTPEGMPTIILTGKGAHTRRSKKGLHKQTEKQKAATEPYLFKPGYDPRRPQAGKLLGRNNVKISDSYRAQLGDRVPPEMIAWFALPKGTRITWAELISSGMMYQAASGETSAAKEIREVTEGRLPEHMSFDGKIDYSAGKTAKEKLVKALMPEKK